MAGVNLNEGFYYKNIFPHIGMHIYFNRSGIFGLVDVLLCLLRVALLRREPRKNREISEPCTTTSRDKLKIYLTTIF